VFHDVILTQECRSDRKLEPLKKIGYKASLFLFTMTKGNINIASTETPPRADVDAKDNHGIDRVKLPIRYS